MSRILKALHLHKEEVKDVKDCPFCLESIPGKATRCKACTAEQPAKEEPAKKEAAAPAKA